MVLSLRRLIFLKEKERYSVGWKLPIGIPSKYVDGPQRLSKYLRFDILLFAIATPKC